MSCIIRLINDCVDSQELSAIVVVCRRFRQSVGPRTSHISAVMDSDSEHDFGAQPGVTKPANAKVKAKAKSKGKIDPKAEAANKTCIVKKCIEPCYQKKKWCILHKRSVDAMDYQAGKSPVPGAVDALKKVLANDELAAEEIFQFAQLNPPDKAYHKKQVIDWSRFVKKHGLRMSSIDRTGRVPITEKAFLIRKTNKEGIDLASAQQLWDMHYADKNCRPRQLGRFRGVALVVEVEGAED